MTKPSSIIAGIDFRGLERGELEVTLTTGQSFAYTDVPRRVYEDFTFADSLGGFYNKNIRSKYEVR